MDNIENKEKLENLVGKSFFRNLDPEILEDEEVKKATSEIGEFLLELLAVVEMPDEEFKILAPFILHEFEKSTENPQDLMVLARELQFDSIDSQEVIQMYMNLVNGLAEERPDLSEEKLDFLRMVLMTVVNAYSEAEVWKDSTVQIPIEFCRAGAEMPRYARMGDAGMDLVALEEYEIQPGETKLIPTGIKVAVPPGYALLIQPRSGLSLHSKLRIANTPGLIDSGYRGEISVIVENIAPRVQDIGVDYDETGKATITSVAYNSPYTIEKGQKFAQMRLVKAPIIGFYEVGSVLEIGEDRGGGFGSTDEKKDGDKK